MFLGPHKMKMSHYFSVLNTLWNLGLFLFKNFKLFPTETWDFFYFLTTPPPFGPFPKFPRPLLWKASLMRSVLVNWRLSTHYRQFWRNITWSWNFWITLTSSAGQGMCGMKKIFPGIFETRWPGAVPQSIKCIRFNNVSRLR